MSAKVADEQSTTDESITDFKRKSIDMGVAVNVDAFMLLAKKIQDFDMFAKTFIDVVKGCKGNLDNAVQDFCDSALGEGDEVAREILMALAPKIKPLLKMARIGLGSRILLSLVLTYTDIVTDILVLKEYGVGGKETRKAFHSSCGILGLCTLVNILVAWIANKNKTTALRVRAMIFALIQLNPLVHGINAWRGVETSEDDTMSSFFIFVMVRIGELIFEVLPESVLQLFVVYHTKKVSYTVIFSILSSVASAAFIMTDNSLMYERGEMSHQKRGPYSHPIFGFIPVGPRAKVAMQLGMFLFYGGYLACAMLNISAALTAFHWGYVPIVMFCEFVGFFGLRASRGDTINILEAPGGWIMSSLLHFVCYLMMCMAPWTQLRVDFGNLGGRHYASMIIYRLLSYTAIVIHATNNFADIDAGERTVRMRVETVRFYFFIALGVTLFGAALFLANVHKLRRWTFYESRQTGLEFFKWYFEASQLIDDADTKDPQRVFVWLLIHPNYFDKDAVKDWLLKLKSDGEILGMGNKKLPKGCGSRSGHTLESFFSKSLQKFSYYGDVESTTEVEAHIKKLKQEVDSRPLVDDFQAFQRKPMKFSGEKHEDNDISKAMSSANTTEDKYTNEVRKALELKNAEIAGIKSVNETLVGQLKDMEKEIKRLKEALSKFKERKAD